ncbi:SAM-dependent methyltransferase [Actinokineospora iranica]|uniref:Cyclopropane fatty-acyl-phospholipid synthase n=1 Tax=Actinokineospora iranica TaxID=1271860 RepID=A0A1G6S294_9PSEU|nr:class I SAM-dependent methyltransferase [Actinokineospora iranica]SDD10801.1 Cyclopropane fatty-acyl-phospholipid synthase [Actinokineospora iranica]
MTATQDELTTAATAPTPEQVGANYDEFGDLYALTIGDVGIHIGMWVPPNGRGSVSTLGDLANLAQERQTEHHIDTIGLGQGEHLLDIGCGTGGPAVRVAERSGGRVTGITVSRTQVDTATGLARARGVADRVTFALGNAMDLDFADETFDAAMAIDVFAHLSDRRQGLRETWRVLRPGGHFMMSEFTARGNPTDEQLAAYTRTWCCAPPISPATALELAETAGFELVKVENMTESCSFTGEVMGLLYADRHDEIVARYGPELVAQMDEVVPLVRSFIRDHLGYYLFLLRKPR